MISVLVPALSRETFFTGSNACVREGREGRDGLEILLEEEKK